MIYKKYIVSFIPGSSGNFVKCLLDRIVRNSNDEINICENNSTHYDHTYTGISIENPNRKNIYDILHFDILKYRPKDYSSILTTHVYPNFDVINNRFTDIKIVLIEAELDDLKEIIFNSYFKNKHEIRQISKIDIKDIRFHYKLFLENDKIIPENCTVIKYKNIFTPVLYEKLTEITGIKDFPDSVYRAVDQYWSNRSRLVNEFGLR